MVKVKQIKSVQIERFENTRFLAVPEHRHSLGGFEYFEKPNQTEKSVTTDH